MIRSSSAALAVALAVSTSAACKKGGNSDSAPAVPSPSVAASTPKSDALVGAPPPRELAPSIGKINRSLNAFWGPTALSANVDDASFYRRVSLDLHGVIPKAQDVAEFVADQSADKHAALVKRLIEAPQYAKRWTDYWDDLLMGASRSKEVDRVAFRRWLHLRLAENVGFDKLATQLLTATGTNSEGGRVPRAAFDELPDTPIGEADGVNGAVNWLLTGSKEPQNLSGATSRIFLGVQIQCAECHDHPTEKWSQQDFKNFTSALVRSNVRNIDKGKVMGVRRVEVLPGGKLSKRTRRRLKKAGYLDGVTPTALDGTSLEGPGGSRVALAKWMTKADNPYFARTIVNRMWSEFLGAGFAEPIDDYREGQKVHAAETLKFLTKDFVDHGFDLQRLMTLIVFSKAYQRSSRGPGAKKPWAQFALRPMSADQLLDSLVVATGVQESLEDILGERMGKVKARLRKNFTFVFDVDEDSADDAFSGTAPQSLMLLNGPLVAVGSTMVRDTTLAGAVALDGGPDAVVTALYLAALSRRPDATEMNYWKERVSKTAAGVDLRQERQRRRDLRKGKANKLGPVGRLLKRRSIPKIASEDVAYEDLFWALLNSSEFYFIH